MCVVLRNPTIMFTSICRMTKIQNCSLKMLELQLLCFLLLIQKYWRRSYISLIICETNSKTEARKIQQPVQVQKLISRTCDRFEPFNILSSSTALRALAAVPRERKCRTFLFIIWRAFLRSAGICSSNYWREEKKHYISVYLFIFKENLDKSQMTVFFSCVCLDLLSF